MRGSGNMDDVDIFDQCMKSQGGRFNRASIAPELWKTRYGHLVELAERLIGSARANVPGLPPIYFDFVQNATVNACAFKAEGRYFIAFNTGTRFMLELIFFRMLADGRIYPSVGDAGAEVNNLANFDYSMNADESLLAGIRPSRPKSDLRWSFACELMRKAFYFIIGHEIAHISRGHVDYLNSKYGNPFLPEIAWNLPTGPGEVERQALEADADKRSVLSAMVSAKTMHETPVSEVPPWVQGRHFMDDLLFDWSFAMNVFFRVFGDIKVHEADVSASSYPPEPLRRFMATLSAHHFICALLKAPDEATVVSMIEALKNGAVYTEIGFDKIMGHEYTPGGLEDAFSDRGFQYAMELEAYWMKTLWPKVRKFAFESGADEGIAG